MIRDFVVELEASDLGKLAQIAPHLVEDGLVALLCPGGRAPRGAKQQEHKPRPGEKAEAVASLLMLFRSGEE
jgi:hypothetical protein